MITSIPLLSQLPPALLWASAGLLFAVEVVFYLVFRFYLVPRANQHIPPQPYRDYGRDRHKVLFRIVNRALRVAKLRGMDEKTAMIQYVNACFDPIEQQESLRMTQENLKPFQQEPPAMLPVSRESMSTVSNSTHSSSSTAEDTTSISSSDVEDDDDHGVSKTWTVDGYGRDDMDQLFCWALFGKTLDQFQDWEHVELQKCYDEMEQRLGVVFPPGSGGRYKARQLSLEDVSPLHRPLVVYLWVRLVAALAGLILRCAGYTRIQASNGLGGWYRPARENAQQLLPLLFFHGIAPGGLFFYLPIVLLGLVNDGRASFLLENTNISCRLGFRALTEVETVQGVAELVDQYLEDDSANKDRPLSLVGHSFGSVPLTWLLHSEQFRHRIQQFVLLDPVTILISEPDVMVNFLYKKSISKIRMLAASELFTEYYLRRHFFFYNSELWLDHVPAAVQPIIALSEKDEIVPANKVKDHLGMFASDKPTTGQEDPFQLVFWKGVAHAACVTSPTKWKEIKTAMLQQELALVQQERQ